MHTNAQLYFDSLAQDFQQILMAVDNLSSLSNSFFQLFINQEQPLQNRENETIIIAKQRQEQNLQLIKDLLTNSKDIFENCKQQVKLGIVKLTDTNQNYQVMLPPQYSYQRNAIDQASQLGWSMYHQRKFKIEPYDNPNLNLERKQVLYQNLQPSSQTMISNEPIFQGQPPSLYSIKKQDNHISQSQSTNQPLSSSFQQQQLLFSQQQPLSPLKKIEQQNLPLKDNSKMDENSEDVNTEDDNDDDNDDDETSDQDVNSSQNLYKKRGKYKNYSEKLKQEAINLKCKDHAKVVKELGVPLKNLKRWIKVGAQRQKGGGRKILDVDMEAKLAAWILKEVEARKDNVLQREIKKKAKQLSNHKNRFRASKGWFDKFCERYNIIKQVNQLLERFGKTPIAQVEKPEQKQGLQQLQQKQSPDQQQQQKLQLIQVQTNNNNLNLAQYDKKIQSITIGNGNNIYNQKNIGSSDSSSYKNNNCIQSSLKEEGKQKQSHYQSLKQRQKEIQQIMTNEEIMERLRANKYDTSDLELDIIEDAIKQQEKKLNEKIGKNSMITHENEMDEEEMQVSEEGQEVGLKQEKLKTEIEQQQESQESINNKGNNMEEENLIKQFQLKVEVEQQQNINLKTDFNSENEQTQQ